MNVLYVIGNGFDIYHGIRSKYADFKAYLSYKDKPLHDLVEQYIPVDSNWSDFESALAAIDIDAVREDASQYLVSYAAEDWRDAYNHDYQYEIEQIVVGLSSKLKFRFSEWGRQLSIPARNELAVRLLDISPSEKFLTFNYTSTLSDIYGVPRANVCYLHGDAKIGQNLVLGHTWRPAPRTEPKCDMDFDLEASDVRLIEGEDLLDHYFSQTFKDTKRIIADNIDFFTSFKNLHKIVVLGHSLSPVDADYYREIVKNVDLRTVEWQVTYCGEDERLRHMDTLRNFGVPLCAISLIEMNALQ